MQTTRVLSNISYNSIKFFETKIKELEERGLIDWAYWVYHYADEDELKDHIHFTFKPSKRIDTAKFRELLFEFDQDNPGKPRTCTKVFKPNNSMEDWLLYAIHDPAYLQSKGQYRRHHYKFEDLKSTDMDALLADFTAINRKKYYLLQWLEDAALSGTPFFILVQQGLVPMSQRAQYEFQYNALVKAIENEKNKTTGRKESHEGDLQEVDTVSPFDNQ